MKFKNRYIAKQHARQRSHEQQQASSTLNQDIDREIAKPHRQEAIKAEKARMAARRRGELRG